MVALRKGNLYLFSVTCQKNVFFILKKYKSAMSIEFGVKTDKNL